MISARLHELRKMFQNEGFDINLVGGCVRDKLLGKIPHDIDLATNANPEQQHMIYKKYGISCVDTGLQHGTWTVVFHDPLETYEITSLRRDTETDGRHATVEYISDWREDSLRRDFTINAMFQSFDGQIIDYFNGQEDLSKGIIRFVGDANKRIKEDYLRILRFYRFFGRFGIKDLDFDNTTSCITNNSAGLQLISVERIWSEMKQILALPNVCTILQLMRSHKVESALGVQFKLEKLPMISSKLNPISVLACISDFQSLAQHWKLSTYERKFGEFIEANESLSYKKAKEFLSEGVDASFIKDALLINNKSFSFIENWKIPMFPIKGEMLMPKFAGPALGKELKRLRQIWYNTNFDDMVVMSELEEKNV